MPESRKNVPKIITRRIIGFGEADGGSLLCIQIKDQNGTDAVIMIPKELEGEFLARFQSASSFAAAKRGKPPVPETIAAMRVEGFGIGKARDGTAVLQMRLASGIKLDFGLDLDTQIQLRTLLDAIEQTPPPPSGTHRQH